MCLGRRLAADLLSTLQPVDYSVCLLPTAGREMPAPVRLYQLPLRKWGTALEGELTMLQSIFGWLIVPPLGWLYERFWDLRDIQDELEMSVA